MILSVTCFTMKSFIFQNISSSKLNFLKCTFLCRSYKYFDNLDCHTTIVYAFSYVFNPAVIAIIRIFLHEYNKRSYTTLHNQSHNSILLQQLPLVCTPCLNISSIILSKSLFTMSIHLMERKQQDIALKLKRQNKTIVLFFKLTFLCSLPYINSKNKNKLKMTSAITWYETGLRSFISLCSFCSHHTSIKLLIITPVNKRQQMICPIFCLRFIFHVPVDRILPLARKSLEQMTLKTEEFGFHPQDPEAHRCWRFPDKQSLHLHIPD